MLSSISWNQYITSIGILLLFYYCFVGFKYFRWEILSLAGITKADDNTIAFPAVAGFQQHLKTENHEDYLPKQDLETDISPLVQSFIDEVQAFVTSANSNIPKPEMLYLLQVIASKYPVLKTADCKDELTVFVFNTIQQRFLEMVEQNEVAQIWV